MIGVWRLCRVLTTRLHYKPRQLKYQALQYTVLDKTVLNIDSCCTDNVLEAEYIGSECARIKKKCIVTHK